MGSSKLKFYVVSTEGGLRVGCQLSWLSVWRILIFILFFHHRGKKL